MVQAQGHLKLFGTRRVEKPDQEDPTSPMSGGDAFEVARQGGFTNQHLIVGMEQAWGSARQAVSRIDEKRQAGPFQKGGLDLIHLDQAVRILALEDPIGRKRLRDPLKRGLEASFPIRDKVHKEDGLLIEAEAPLDPLELLLKRLARIEDGCEELRFFCRRFRGAFHRWVPLYMGSGLRQGGYPTETEKKNASPLGWQAILTVRSTYGSGRSCSGSQTKAVG